MMAKKCFEPGCTNEVEHACFCSSPETLSCEVHAVEHLKLPNRAHNLESIFMQPCDGNIEPANVKDSISLIRNEDSKSLKGTEEEKKPIKKAPEHEASLLNSQISIDSNDLNSKPKDAESALNLIDTLRNKAAEILSRPNNPELEIDFRATCSAIQSNSSFYDPSLMQAYQDYLNAYQQKTSLYSITQDDNEYDITYLVIYSTESEIEKELKTLQTPEPLDLRTCITQLPNGKLFCFGNYKDSGIAVQIDVNGESKFCHLELLAMTHHASISTIASIALEDIMTNI
ncbi:unnamed protein product [Blepharisma stoltei]|uniref:Uncharacterized protein n=1 Tax=Blepharisma stoltei TaxID=1481888 RepID=A0AAU9ISR6_9CILI|nr:unnamed protein product [Blepharisma stoltei]